MSSSFIRTWNRH